MIYFVQHPEDCFIKIGTTNNIHVRLARLRQEYRVNLQLLGICDGSYEEESRLHQDFNADWRFGEWFKPSERLMSFIADNTHLNLPKRSKQPAKLSRYKPSLDVVIPQEVRAQLDDMAAQETQPGHKVYAADIVRRAIQQMFDREGINLRVEVDRGGDRRKK